MKKEEILAKSKEENRKKDPYKMEVQSKAERVSGLGTLALATILFVIEGATGNDFNFGLYAVLTSFGGFSSLVKAIYLRRKRDIFFAVVYLTATIILSVIHIINLLS